MPYSTIADLPPAFKNLPDGAKSIAMRTMNAILDGKEETPDLVTQAVQAAWANIKRDYRQSGDTWVRKVFKASAEEANRLDAEVAKITQDWIAERVPWAVNVGPTFGNVSIPRDWARDLADVPVFKVDPAGLAATHDLLAAEMTRRKMRHITPLGKADPGAVTKFVSFLKRDDEKRIVYGIVLEPGDPEHPDAQGDWLKPDQIETAAHDFMRRYRAAKAGLGLQHEKAAPEVDVVENYIAPADFEMNGQKVKQGSWVLGSYVGDDKIWKAVKAGELTGYSIGGTGERVTP